jgi:hypothetical protein
MSHFTVLVVGEDPEWQLAPFQENNMGDCPREYLVLEDLTEEVEEGYRLDGEPGSLDEYAKLQGYSKDRETGRYGYWINPDSQWDWYELGGRWRNYFKLKKGTTYYKHGNAGLNNLPLQEGYADMAYKKDIDWEGMRAEKYVKALELWEKAKKETDPTRYFLYGIQTDDTRESFVQNYMSPATYAILKDGEWRDNYGSSGRQSWIEEFDKLITELPDDTLLSVWDCHI